MLSAIKEKTYFGAGADCAVFRETVLITVGGVGWGWVGCDYWTAPDHTGPLPDCSRLLSSCF